MNTIFIYASQYKNEIKVWMLSNELTPKRYIQGDWTKFGYYINEICHLITLYKPNQIIFEEYSEYEDSIWDAVTSKCDNELNITIDKNGKIIYNQ